MSPNPGGPVVSLSQFFTSLHNNMNTVHPLCLHNGHFTSWFNPLRISLFHEEFNILFPCLYHFYVLHVLFDLLLSLLKVTLTLRYLRSCVFFYVLLFRLSELHLHYLLVVKSSVVCFLGLFRFPASVCLIPCEIGERELYET